MGKNPGNKRVLQAVIKYLIAACNLVSDYL
jgi:hypothetical protein